jgi:hypothetical protein
MDQTVEQIEAHIDRTRDRLGSSLRELEGKVEAATDWREHFRARPWLMVGAACVGGAVLATTLRPRTARRVDGLSGLHVVAPERTARGHRVLGEVVGLWDNVTAALVGVASERVRDYIAELVPGFDEQFTRVEQRRPMR